MVQLRLGVDFVLPLSQEQEEEEPHINLWEGLVLKVWNYNKRTSGKTLSPKVEFDTGDSSFVGIHKGPQIHQRLPDFFTNE